MNEPSDMSDCHSNDVKVNTGANQNNDGDLEKQRVAQPSSSASTRDADDNTQLTIVVSTGESKPISEVPGPGTLCSQEGLLPCSVSSKKELLSTTSSSDEQCRYI